MTTNHAPNPGDTVTSNTTMPPPDYTCWLDDDLLDHLDWLTAMKAAYSEQLGRCEQEIHRRLAARGATAIPSETFVCEIVTSYTYDQPTLTPLLEMLNNVELAKCYEAAYTPDPVEVPAKWRVQQLLAVARRRGTEALAVVEQAKVESGRKLRFEKRKVIP